MAQDDLATWLKVSAENKITTKNAWKSTLIEYFADPSYFKGREGINFQKAGCALEGCVKVYSTRVDDVSENTNRLLSMFRKEDSEPKARPAKKSGNFIEKNMSNIDLRELPLDTFYDPVFASILQGSGGRFLLDALERTAAGTLLYSSPGSSGIVFSDEEVNISLRALPVCASLREIKEMKGADESIAAVEDEYVHGQYDAADDFGEIDDGGLGDIDHWAPEADADGDGGATAGSEHAPVIADGNDCYVYSDNPFGYFKGWAGPSHWRVSAPPSRRGNREKKPRERVFIDFTAELDLSSIVEQADTTMAREVIVERRRNKNMMPTDHAYSTADLYKFMLRSDYIVYGAYTAASQPAAPEVQEECARDYEDIGDGPEASFIGAADGSAPDHSMLSERLEHSMVLDGAPAFKMPKAPKRVDMKRLKENVHKLLGQSSAALSDICRGVSTFYDPKERKDISPHLCLISLLHIANENSYELSAKGSDLLVHR
ncbi:condensin complex subunit 2 [Pancytospora philotis]|nr:condensin complex subunit 2 [Pancytospora philotis]